MLTWESLPALFPDCAEPDRWLPVLRRHADLVERAPVRATAVTGEAVIARHYAESLEAWRLAGAPPEGAVVDVGSGAGFPGIVIAAVAPNVEVHLVEARQRRAELLSEMAEALGLDRVRVHAERAEEAGRGELRDSAGLVIARAVAPLATLLEYTAPLAATGGVIVAVKGSRGGEELAGAGPAASALRCEHLTTEPMRGEIAAHMTVLRFRKLGATPERYPRRAGTPARRPLGAS